MEPTLFDELVQSLKEANAISRGELQASRRFKVSSADVKSIREKIGISQNEFAELMQVSIKTLQNWEQNRRNPTGPAEALINVIIAEPDLALSLLKKTKNKNSDSKFSEKITAKKLFLSYENDVKTLLTPLVVTSKYSKKNLPVSTTLLDRYSEILEKTAGRVSSVATNKFVVVLKDGSKSSIKTAKPQASVNAINSIWKKWPLEFFQESKKIEAH